MVVATHFSGIKSGVPSDILACEYSVSAGKKLIANLIQRKSTMYLFYPCLPSGVEINNSKKFTSRIT